jgi:hypothetical protein
MALVGHAESDAWLALGLMFYLSVVPLTLQLSNLSGFLWARTLQVCLECPPMPLNSKPVIRLHQISAHGTTDAVLNFSGADLVSAARLDDMYVQG